MGEGAEKDEKRKEILFGNSFDLNVRKKLVNCDIPRYSFVLLFENRVLRRVFGPKMAEVTGMEKIT